MRSFTKKNVTLNEDVWKLCFSDDPDLKTLRAELSNEKWKTASQNVVHLFSGTKTNKKLEEIFDDVNVDRISGGMFTNLGFVDVGAPIDGTVAKIVSELNPSPADLERKLIADPGINLNAVKAKKVGRLLMVWELMRFAKIRAGYDNLFNFEIYEKTKKDKGRLEKLITGRYIFNPVSVRENPFTEDDFNEGVEDELDNKDKQWKAFQNIRGRSLTLKNAYEIPAYTKEFKGEIQQIFNGGKNNQEIEFALGEVKVQVEKIEKGTKWLKNSGSPTARQTTVNNEYILIKVNDAENIISKLLTDANKGVFKVLSKKLKFIEGDINYPEPKSIATGNVDNQTLPKDFDIRKHQSDQYLFPLPSDSEKFRAFNLLKFIHEHYEDAGANKGYRLVKLPLVKSQGLYCAFCESPLNDGRNGDIEHKLPKSVHPSQALLFENFVHACKICNSDNKGEWIAEWVKENKIELRLGRGFTEIEYKHDASNTTNYLMHKKNALENVVWPDRRSIIKTKNKKTSSFALFKYEPLAKPTPNSFNPDDAISVITNDKKKGFLLRYNAYQITPLFPASQRALEKEKNIIENIIGICGLDRSIENKLKPHKSKEEKDEAEKYWNDLRHIRRTKASLFATMQLSILKNFKSDLSNLASYYQVQLHPQKIGTVPVLSRIEKLKELNPISGAEVSITFPNDLSLPSGPVDFTSTNNVVMSYGASCNSWQLKGRLKDSKFTGTFTEKDSGEMISFWESSWDSTSKTLQEGKKIDSSTELREWEGNRNDVVNQLHAAETYIQSMIWTNILNMVRDGGFYSTWVRTFEHYCSGPSPEIDKPYHKELVARLEEASQKYPDDPFQFHGTDAVEIIESLA